MKGKDIVKLLTFVIVPAGLIAGTIYYGPKIKKWYLKRKTGEYDIRIENVPKGYFVSVYKDNKYIGAIKGAIATRELAEQEGSKIVEMDKKKTE